MKKIILNHKSYLTYEDTKEFIKKLKQLEINGKELIVLPSIPFISMYKEQKITLGIQNFYSRTEGPYTGEVNLDSLKSMGVTYTLIGHSERRVHNLDSYEQIKEKLFKSINSNFKTILCVGELKKEKTPFKYIKRELDYYLKMIDISKLNNLIIAYEPHWNIGSSDELNIEKIKTIVNRIESYFVKKYDKKIEIIYGGGVTKENSKEILSFTSGILLGTKSTDISYIKEI